MSLYQLQLLKRFARGFVNIFKGQRLFIPRRWRIPNGSAQNPEKEVFPSTKPTLPFISAGLGWRGQTVCIKLVFSIRQGGVFCLFNAFAKVCLNHLPPNYRSAAWFFSSSFHPRFTLTRLPSNLIQNNKLAQDANLISSGEEASGRRSATRWQ